ncbi:hypothetical protein ACV3VS_08990 [Clostridium perfringens]|uniref:hypothetical protein n=1 Tax=Clostridium perfringens TaxID=1502 RepID=UPI0013E3DE97|nr:hypothetical protein [Clostridium perfringens]MDM0720337.1 hypothetical protein [Clostridium perfringens]MDM0723403.1 hypothetical protein [Clostridium perfringens]QPS27032.1 hypothetical protein I6G61_11405 [Clostridium perfringens]UBK42098.1 hypothetical protein KLF28_06280 [Clostridium perfringens]
MVREILDKRWWKVLGKFNTKEELIDSVRTVLEEQELFEEDIEYYLNNIENEDLDLGKVYVLSMSNYFVMSYEDVIKSELADREERKKENIKRRQAQLNMSVDDYRIVQKQKQAEYLVAREMKRMAKMIGRKKLLSYEPKVHVLNKKHWKKDECIGYVTKDNMIFLPEYYFKKRSFYDPNGYGLKNVIYKKDEKIVKVIRHELTHLFVREEFKDTTSIKEIENDASPICLYYLAFFGADFGGGYKVQSKYEKELCKQVKEMTHKDIKNKCLKLLGKIELMFEWYIENNGFITFTTDNEESYIGEWCQINLGYKVIDYSYSNFLDLKDKFISKLKEKSKEIKKEQPNAA